ncbi:GNAT family N-acetyltransferase [Kribbia dieselivorans]|uniref:GNAT family N-acetyltransferase n=1 Tax=Kribbia dieselivorans TaxID=331526 RepID=UPI000AE2D144|nr:GNAT family N-acetyltransferase [Kribbia dieselivorans]
MSLRQRTAVRSLSRDELDIAVDLCALDPAANVFVAARIAEQGWRRSTAVLGHYAGGALTSLCWTGANVVPVQSDPDARAGFAERLRRYGNRAASLLGPQEAVLDLWSRLSSAWGPARAIRGHQPLMATRTPPSVLGIPIDPRVRPARMDEVDLVLPAAAHMFTHEIGYPPYTTNKRAYRQIIEALVARNRTYVIVEGGEVIFKADIGSVAVGAAQVQGVWLAPHLRGHGLSTPAMAAVTELAMHDFAPLITLYVNDFNLSARALYERIGFTEVGAFATVLL